MSEVLLKAENVSIVFGGLKAVSDFDFYINKGELIGLIGPNGALGGISLLMAILNLLARALWGRSLMRLLSEGLPVLSRISVFFLS